MISEMFEVDVLSAREAEPLPDIASWRALVPSAENLTLHDGLANTARKWDACLSPR